MSRIQTLMPPRTTVPTALNPADVDNVHVIISAQFGEPNVQISNDIVAANTDVGGVRAVLGVSAGKWYWEIMPNYSPSNVIIGVCTASASRKVGTDASGWGFMSSGNKITNNVQTAYSGQTIGSSKVGVALDMDNGTIAFTLPGGAIGTAFTGLSGTLYPCIWGANTGGSFGAFCNFRGDPNMGNGAFAYPIPAGYSILGS